MVSKKIDTLIMAVAITFLCTGCFSKKEIIESEQAVTPKVNNVPTSTIVKQKPVVKKVDLYSSTPYDLPLFSVVEISKLPENVKKSVDRILNDSQGIYLLRFDQDRVLVILQNPVATSETYQRHGLQFAEIAMDGSVTYHNAGYSGVDGEIFSTFDLKEESWLFDESFEPFRPLKHTVYDEKGKIKFVETWNYDDSESIKYQMKDGHKKIVSILKESQDNESNLRREHVFYDNEGNTKMSFTINYDGANISRLTFYNAHDSIDSMSIITEYQDGVRVKESIYNEEYQLVNTVKSEYVDNVRKNIVIYDVDGKEINKISS